MVSEYSKANWLVGHCVNVTKNFLKIYLKLSGIGDRSNTKIGVVLIIKLFADLMKMTLSKFWRFEIGEPTSQGLIFE